MKRNFLLVLLTALTFVALACQKQETEAERNARIEREVQQRVAAERQADEQQKLAERQAELDAREQALAAQENRPAVTVTATPVARESTPAAVATTDSEGNSYGTFYRKLEPYGDWMETGDYGYVFQPRQAAQSRDWRPYTNGHWVYTDAGWTWISNEKFGWATYHYGRWVRLRSVGWVWVPGEQWAPAWVSWRKGGDYVGWAPLPPEAQFDRRTGIHHWADNYYDIGPDQYAFVPANEFGRKLSSREILPTERNVTIINQTTNVTNIVYNNSFIVDRGPSYEDLRSRSRQPIERYRLERSGNLNNETPVFRGEVVALPTANFRPAQQTARPNRVVKTIAQPVVERGWSAIKDAQAAQKARAKMKAEATPPPNLPPKKFVRPTPAAPAPRAEASAVPVSTPRATAPPAATPARTQTTPPREVIPPPPAVKQITPVPSATPMESVAATASPTPVPTVSDAMQPSPAENVFSPKAADRYREEKAQQEKRKEREAAQAQRQAERRQKMGERRSRKQESTEPTPSATPAESAATATPSASAVEPSPAASAPSPTAAEEMTAAERRQARRAARRAKRGVNEPEPAASPTPQQP
ncbi:hypothetical protein BH20VER3_BH20VER3_16790 [soil metagenome]